MDEHKRNWWEYGITFVLIILIFAGLLFYQVLTSTFILIFFVITLLLGLFNYIKEILEGFLQTLNAIPFVGILLGVIVKIVFLFLGFISNLSFNILRINLPVSFCGIGVSLVIKLVFHI